MKKLFKTFTVLGAILLICGAGLLLAGVSMGGKLEIIWKQWDEQPIPDGEVIMDSEKVREIEIEMAAGEMVIEQGNYDSVMIAADHSKMKVDAKADGDELNIEGSGRLGNHGGIIKVYLPEKLELEQLSIHVGAGSVTADRLVAEQLSLEVGAGDVSIKRAKSQYTDLECSMGNIAITMEGSSKDYAFDGEHALGSLTYDGNSGDMEIVSDDVNRKIEASCSLGNIEIDFTD